MALTGAGISVPSGIPDFRSPGTGIWENVDPFEVATIDAFHRDPARFWSFYRPRFEALGDVSPNPAHEALAALERRGLLEAVITQNVDRLHRKAGSRRLIEVHGSIDTSSCTSCGASWSLDEVDGLFDELLPEAAMVEAQQLAARAELMLCVGYSLEVHPVAGLPELTLASGGRVAIITKGPTPYDDDAAVRMDGDVVEALGAVLDALPSAE